MATHSSILAWKIPWTEEAGGQESKGSQRVGHNTHPNIRLLLSHFSCVQLCATPQTAAHQAPLSLGFSRQEYWSGVPLPSPKVRLVFCNKSFLCFNFHTQQAASYIWMVPFCGREIHMSKVTTALSFHAPLSFFLRSHVRGQNIELLYFYQA